MPRRRLALIAAALTTGVLVAGALTLHVARPRPLHLPEGVVARPLTLDGRLDVVRVDDDRITLALAAGRARFTVPPDVRRVVAIEVGAARLRVDGAVFEVERADDAAEVVVERGAVRVERAGERQTVEAGDAVTVPLR